MRLTKHALVVTDRQLIPAWAGNRLRIHALLRVLRELDWKVVLIGSNLGAVDALRPLVHRVILVKARSFGGGRLTRFDVRPFTATVARVAEDLRPALAIAQYAWLAPVLRTLPQGAERWVDCHDILHERAERFARSGLDPWTVCSRDEELALLASGDVLITCQHRDAAVLRDLMPNKKVVCIMTPVDAPHDFVPRTSRSHTVLAVGARHAGNDGIADFVRDGWPRVTAKHGDARLTIVGGVGDTIGPRPGVEIVGPVADVHPYYDEAAVVVCPVTVGTGVKTKMLEALRLGKATVVTEMAEEGLPIPASPAWLTGVSLESCGDLVGELLGDAARRAALEREAFAFGLQHVALDVFRARVAAQLPQVADAPPATVIVSHVGSTVQLQRCLSALQTQRYAGSIREVVVVDGIPDEAPAWIAMDGPALLMSRSPSLRRRDARLHGATLATGSVLAFIDSDCEPESDWLDTSLGMLQRNPRDTVVLPQIRTMVPRGGPIAAQWYDAALTRRADRVEGGLVTEHALVIWRSHWQRIVDAPLDMEEGAALRSCDARVRHRPAADWRELRDLVRRQAWLDDGERRSAGALSPARRWHAALALARRDVTWTMRTPHMPLRIRPQVACVALLSGYWRLRAWRDMDRAAIHDIHASAAASLPTHGTPVRARCSIESISVIIPTAGWPETIAACLDSVRAQCLDVRVEIVVVVNGPAVPVPRERWPDVVFVHEPKRGPAAARNAGVRASSGDVLAFIDADCVAMPGWLAAALTTMRNGHVGSVIAGAITRSGAGESVVSLFDSVTFLQQERYVRGSRNFVTANLIVHRAVFDRIGPFDERFNEAAFEDWDWGHRARRAGVALLYDAAATVDHPCMRHLDELRRKAQRLARGERLMRGKRRETAKPRGLFSSVVTELRRVSRETRVDANARRRLMVMGALFAYWRWRA